MMPANSHYDYAAMNARADLADERNDQIACGENPRMGDFQGWVLSDGKFVRADSYSKAGGPVDDKTAAAGAPCKPPVSAGCTSADVPCPPAEVYEPTLAELVASERERWAR